MSRVVTRRMPPCVLEGIKEKVEFGWLAKGKGLDKFIENN